MKRIKILITTFCSLLLGITSCNDSDFLKEDPETIYTIENAFNTSSQVEANVTNLYLHIRYWFQNTYFMKGLGTDLLDSPQWRSAGNGYSNYTKWSSDYGEVRSVYDAFYQLAAYANTTIYGTELTSISWNKETDRLYAMSQAKFFRGFAYLSLGEMFGGVPLVDKVYTTPKFDFVRSSREDTYRFAIQDFEDALEGMPDYPTEAGRVAKGATYHYLAEAYLALATTLNNDKNLLDKSIDYASKAMGLHSLMTERFGGRAIAEGGVPLNGVAAYVPNGDVFFDLFQRNNLDYSEGNKEALWTLQNDYQVYKKFGGNQVLAYPREFGPVLRNVNWKPEYQEGKISPWDGDVSAYVGGRAVSSVAPTNYVTTVVWANKFAKDMRNSEVNIRRDFKCTDPGHSMYGKPVLLSMLEASTLDRYYPVWTKFSPLDDWGYEDLADGGNRSNMYRDEYACRLSETYLLRAEAYFRLGDNGKAAEDINALRRRAQCEYEVVSADINIQLILDERVRELFMEERRWCTLLRMGGTIAKEQVNKYAYYVKDYPSNTGIKDWGLFPIPQTAIDSNTDAVLDQNAGW
ncbi:putative outer membrane starch-binding protein [Dysgonomonas alginatilytica]|uniref:Putative outer membrane starch-binding protein n=1 Tax=Dysgonomonas alginatilytica TaxID=1605892 RepID=A0A2V3PJ90_9BACT|nr:RagB/SusD family nutrient uptake outer membrane protein [Dysgonomonas alginatilytica]PXV60180.1 putative outer membrane starch-binding protein [Dysgonomonas alginatilytica]